MILLQYRACTCEPTVGTNMRVVLGSWHYGRVSVLIVEDGFCLCSKCFSR